MGLLGEGQDGAQASVPLTGSSGPPTAGTQGKWPEMRCSAHAPSWLYPLLSHRTPGPERGQCHKLLICRMLLCSLSSAVSVELDHPQFFTGPPPPQLTPEGKTTEGI